MITCEWQKSSFSGEGANCLEMGWQKSSFSAEAGNCLNLAAAPGRAALLLRESNDPAAVLATTPARLAALLSRLKADRLI